MASFTHPPQAYPDFFVRTDSGGCHTSLNGLSLPPTKPSSKGISGQAIEILSEKN